MEPAEVMRAVTIAAKAGRGAAQGRVDVTAAVAVGPDPKDPVVRAERLALEVLLQMPEKVEPAWAAGIGPETFTVPQYRAVLDGVAAAGGIASAGKDWANRVADEVGEVLAPLVSELIVSPVPQDRPSEMARYVKSVLSRVQDLSLTRRIGEVRGRMQRIGEGNEGYQEAFAELVALEGERRGHREE
jgi:DNA primase